MSEMDGPAEAPGAFGRLLETLCRIMALSGGAILLALAVMTVVSIAGRALFSAPIPGDFELVEVGAAIAIFSFLPYCQLRRGNVIVDVFTIRAGPRVRGLLDALGAFVYALIAALLAWRTFHGGANLKLYGETTMVLRVPVWWGFVPIVPGLVLLTVVAFYTAWRSFAEVKR
tara:strand:+ start:1671 stop:2186 length:516 start_codon:yes stop_codon:yes gene_type:complete